MAVDVSKFLRPAVLPESVIRKASNRQKVLPKLVEKFFPPTPELWTVKAFKAGVRYGSYSAVIIGLLLWREHRFNSDDRPVKLTAVRLRALGIGRYSARSGLTALEKAGLITVQRFRHRSPLITIVED